MPSKCQVYEDNSYLVSRESYLTKRIRPKNQNKFVLIIELIESNVLPFI